MRDHAQQHSYHAGPVLSGRAWSAAPCAGPAAVMLSSCPRIVCAISAGPGIAARFGRRGPAGRGHGARGPAGRRAAAVGICSGSGPAVADPAALLRRSSGLPWAESARRGTGSACPGAVCPGTGSAGAAWAALRAGDLPRLPFRRGTGARIGAGKPPARVALPRDGFSPA